MKVKLEMGRIQKKEKRLVSQTHTYSKSTCGFLNDNGVPFTAAKAIFHKTHYWLFFYLTDTRSINKISICGFALISVFPLCMQ